MSKKPPEEPAPPKEANTAAPGLYEKSDPIPLPEVIDGDPESNWDLWQKTLASEGSKKPPPGTDNFDTTQPLPLAMLDSYTKRKPEG